MVHIRTIAQALKHFLRNLLKSRMLEIMDSSYNEFHDTEEQSYKPFTNLIHFSNIKHNVVNKPILPAPLSPDETQCNFPRKTNLRIHRRSITAMHNTLKQYC